MNADDINFLPTDDSVPSYSELKIMKDILKHKKRDLRKVLSSMKESILVFVLFLVFSMSFVNNYISKFVTDSNYALVIKALIITILFFVITNFYLIKV